MEQGESTAGEPAQREPADANDIHGRQPDGMLRICPCEVCRAAFREEIAIQDARARERKKLVRLASKKLREGL